MSGEYGEVLSLLPDAVKTRRGWMAKCPAHEDKRRSLEVSVAEKTGDLILKCYANCSFDDVLAALGLDRTACWKRREGTHTMPREVATYDYRDEEGQLLYQVVRFEPKDFRQKTPDGKWGLNGARRVLYRLPEVLASGTRTVLIPEGEKDVNCLYSEGLIATCNAMGAGKWQPEYSKSLKDRTVVVLPDNDKPGEEHATSVLHSLQGVAEKVAILRLPGLPPKGDVCDWFNAGGTKEELIKLCKQALAGEVKSLIEAARKLDRRARWMAARQILADLESDEVS